jgi:hypothetical protein
MAGMEMGKVDLEVGVTLVNLKDGQVFQGAIGLNR